LGGETNAVDSDIKIKSKRKRKRRKRNEKLTCFPFQMRVFSSKIKK
jgi:hypothetical protein